MNDESHDQITTPNLDEHSAPEQYDSRRPKPVADEKPMATPEVSQRTADAQYPAEDSRELEVGERHTKAAGMPAVVQSLKFIINEGAVRNTRMLTVVNQKGGFDCPSCAWPDPDGDRHIAEFCENGAKAVAWEATNKRVMPEF